MIILLDIQNKLILLYGEDGVNRIPFHEANVLSSYITDETVYYIINAIEVDANDVINLIDSIEGTQLSISQSIKVDNQRLYIHSSTEKTLYIDEGLKFEGKYNCRLYDDDMREIVESSPLLTQLIKKGDLSIIGEQSRKKIMQEYRNNLNRKEKLEAEKDTKLDSIILEKSVDRAMEEGISSDDDDIVMDLSNDRPGAEGLTEAEENMRMINRPL